MNTTPAAFMCMRVCPRVRAHVLFRAAARHDHQSLPLRAPPLVSVERARHGTCGDGVRSDEPRQSATHHRQAQHAYRPCIVITRCSTSRPTHAPDTRACADLRVGGVGDERDAGLCAREARAHSVRDARKREQPDEVVQIDVDAQKRPGHRRPEERLREARHKQNDVQQDRLRVGGVGCAFRRVCGRVCVAGLNSLRGVALNGVQVACVRGVARASAAAQLRRTA